MKFLRKQKIGLEPWIGILEDGENAGTTVFVGGFKIWILQHGWDGRIGLRDLRKTLLNDVGLQRTPLDLVESEKRCGNPGTSSSWFSRM
jgi:hypothetical protein